MHVCRKGAFGDRLGLAGRCAPSLPKMAYIPGEDGAHPGRAGQTAAAFTDN